ncbi:MAG: aldolase [Rhodospirillales bacterium]|nr:aldolase [Rhodospirillales bacterium]
MQVHGSCAARAGSGILLLGPPGSGKSDLLLRLLDRGFVLVADDRVDVEDGFARAPPALAGLLEIRGLGILRLPSLGGVRLALAARLVAAAEVARLPERAAAVFGVPEILVDPRPASAAALLERALDVATGRLASVAGAFGGSA